MYAKYSKYEFWLTEVRFLGHVVSASEVSVDLEKVEAVMSWERPKSVFKIRSFLGLSGYYRRFIEDFSRIASRSSQLVKQIINLQQWVPILDRNPVQLFVINVQSKGLVLLL